MNDDIIRMARDAGFTIEGPFIFSDDPDNNIKKELARFADIVRADEREACAKVCMEIEQSKPLSDRIGWEHGTVDCQVAILARSKE